MTKQNILDNISYLSAEQLFNEIMQGNVTLEELKATGELDSGKRAKIIDFQNRFDAKDDEAWELALALHNEASIRDYIAKFPKGKHVQEARKEFKIMIDERERELAKKHEILDKVKKNPNCYPNGMIQDYLQKGIITDSDLLYCGIPRSIIDRLSKIVDIPDWEFGKETPQKEKIPEGYTEVYFWGIPGSGKTCALAAILSTAEKLGYLDIAAGPSYDYMTRIKNIFIKENAILPAASPIDTTYLPFALKKDKDKPRSVSLIELSGEVFECFFRKNAGLELGGIHKKAFDSLTNFLKSKNRKIHFFFIDFEKEKDINPEGHTQIDYLAAASTYFKDNNIFDKSSDAIYIVLTKSDLIPLDRTSLTKRDYAKSYLYENFISFINVLKGVCKKYGIGGGELKLELFSLGKVYFKNICQFDDTSAKKIIDILIARIPPDKGKNIFDILKIKLND